MDAQRIAVDAIVALTDCDREAVVAFIRKFYLAGVRDPKRLTFKGLQALAGLRLYRFLTLSYPVQAGYPVRRGLSVQSLTSLEYWITRSARVMTTEYADGDLAAIERPRLASSSLPSRNQRAQGRPGARCTRGLACICAQQGAHEHTGSAETLRPSLRSGFTAYFVLSPVNGSFATVAARELPSHELDASTADVRTTRLRRTHLRLRLARNPRPPHPIPRP